MISRLRLFCGNLSIRYLTKLLLTLLVLLSIYLPYITPPRVFTEVLVYGIQVRSSKPSVIGESNPTSRCRISVGCKVASLGRSSLGLSGPAIIRGSNPTSSCKVGARG